MFTSLPAGAQEVSDFPSCENLEPGDKAHYTEGKHEVAGVGLLEGKDDVHSLGGGNAVQCFCPPTGMGTQTNWLRTDEKFDGWIHIENGKQWNLDDGAYLAMNSKYKCNEEPVVVKRTTGSKATPRIKPVDMPVVVPVVNPVPQPEIVKVTEPLRETLPVTGISLWTVFVVFVIFLIIMKFL